MKTSAQHSKAQGDDSSSTEVSAVFCRDIASILVSLELCKLSFSIKYYEMYFPHLGLELLKSTCGEHAGVRVCGGETHVLLDASARPFGHPLDGQVSGLLHCPPACAALVVNSLHSAVQG